MIQRQGNYFSAGVSTDGVNYQLIPGSTADMDMPATTMQGLAVASGSSTTTGTATFSNTHVGVPVSTTMAPPAPLTRARPAGPAPTWATQPRQVTPPVERSGTLTLSGTGTGFAAALDSSHYVYQRSPATSRSAPRSSRPPARRPRRRKG